jgi:hypothetical protein
MPPPIAYKTVVGTYTAPNGDPVAGAVRFVPLVTVLDPSDNEIVPPLPVTATLDASGHFEVQLMCTDVAGTSPTGWVWSLDERFAGGREEFTFQLPSAGGATVNISDVLPADPIDVTYAYASQASVQAVEARLTALEANATLAAAAYLIHPFVMAN